MSDFDEHGRAAFEGDEIDFTEPASIVARDDLQAFVLQKCGSHCFSFGAAGAHSPVAPSSLPEASVACASHAPYSKVDTHSANELRWRAQRSMNR